MSGLKGEQPLGTTNREQHKKSPGNKYLGLNLITLWILANHFNG